jgi:hypothetical protein
MLQTKSKTATVAASHSVLNSPSQLKANFTRIANHLYKTVIENLLSDSEIARLMISTIIKLDIESVERDSMVRAEGEIMKSEAQAQSAKPIGCRLKSWLAVKNG